MSWFTSRPEPDPGALRHVGAARSARGLIIVVGHLLVFSALIALFHWYALAHDINRDFRSFADSDLFTIYEAVRMNADLPQRDTQHTGYIHYLLLALWYRGAQSLGLLQYASLRDLLYVEDFFGAWQRLAVVGRHFSATFAAGYAFAVYFLVYRITDRDWIATAVATVLFATSYGLALQSLIIRVELTASFFCFLAFAFLVLGARRRGEASTLLYVCLGAFCAGLAVQTKIQSFIVLSIFPALFLVTNGFSDIGRSTESPRVIFKSRSWMPAAVEGRWLKFAGFIERRPILFALLAIPIAWLLIRYGSILLTRTARFPQFGPQLLLYLYIVACFVALARFRRTAPVRQFEILLAALFGSFLSLLVGLYRFHRGSWQIIWNFFDAMMTHTTVDLKHDPASPLLQYLQSVFVKYYALAEPIVARNTDFFPFALAWPGPAPAWTSDAYGWMKLAVIALIGVRLFSRGGWFTAWWAICLLLMGPVLEFVFSLRKLYPIYWIYLEVWPILAVVFLMEYRTFERRSLYFARVGICALFLWRIVPLQWADMNSAKAVMKDDNVCGIIQQYVFEFRDRFKC
jgi:hypothetical protein